MRVCFGNGVILAFTLMFDHFRIVMHTIHTMNFRTLDLNLLRVFDEVMAERSLTRAAHNLSLTQPAVSNALKRLRYALGDELVQRAGFGMQPTPKALELWPAVRSALHHLQLTLAPGQFDPATSSATFVLAMADATAAELVPTLIENIEAHAPNVSVQILPLTTRDPRRWLNEGSMDLAVGHFPAVLADLTAKAEQSEDGAYEHQRLYGGEYVCVMRKTHPLAQSTAKAKAKKPLTLDQFCAAHHLLVSFSGRSFGYVDEALAGLGRKRRIVLTVNQFFTAGRVVARSDLLTVLPRHFVGVADGAQELVVRELPFAVPPVHVDALWHRRRSNDSAHQWLRKALSEAAEAVFGKG